MIDGIQNEFKSNRHGASMTISTLLRPLILKRWLLLSFVCIGAALGVLHVFLADDYYEATLTILPEIGDDKAFLRGAFELASLAGINLNARSDTPMIYRDVLLDPRLVNSVLDAVVEDETTVLEVLDHVDEIRSRQEAVRQILRMVTVVRDVRTNIVKLSVTTPNPELSSTIADAMRTELDGMLREMQRVEAFESQRFLDVQIERAKKRLRDAEDLLVVFRTKNREYQQSPELSRQYKHLERDADLRNTVHLELLKQSEMMWIKAAEDLTLVNATGDAHVWLDPVYPKLSQSLALGVLFGLAVAMMYVYGRYSVLPTLRRELWPDGS